MIRILRNVLTRAEIQHLLALSAQMRFVDGRETNPSSEVKVNEQVSQQDSAGQEPGRILRDALFRHPDVRTFGLPKQMARPTLVRYAPGMTYGWHVDEALFVASQPPLRSDLSCSVFISEPDSYDGGELQFEWGEQITQFKLAAGDAILYPSTTIHQVAPVTRGVRLVGITWLQSWVADAHQRELLIQLEEARAIEAMRDPSPRMKVLLESLRSNLLRMWTDT